MMVRIMGPGLNPQVAAALAARNAAMRGLPQHVFNAVAREKLKAGPEVSIMDMNHVFPPGVGPFSEAGWNQRNWGMNHEAQAAAEKEHQLKHPQPFFLLSEPGESADAPAAEPPDDHEFPLAP